MSDEVCSRQPKKFEDLEIEELEELLNENSCQTQSELAQALGRANCFGTVTKARTNPESVSLGFACA